MAKRKQRNDAAVQPLINTQKRMRRAKPICSCSSPRFSSSPSAFTCYEQDVWTEIAKFMDAKSLVMLATTCRWFHQLVKEGSIWRSLCLRDLQVTSPRRQPSFAWKSLYISSFNGSHLYMFRQSEKHIDLQLVRCPVCELNTCDGTMQTLDARHIELFLSEGCHVMRAGAGGEVVSIRISQQLL